MAFTDPLALALDGATKNLVRVDSGKYSSEYLVTEASQEFKALIRSQDLKAESDGRYKIRHNITLRWTVFATLTAPVLTRQASMTVDHYFGDDVLKWDDVAIAVGGLMTAPNCLKLNNKES